MNYYRAKNGSRYFDYMIITILIFTITITPLFSTLVNANSDKTVLEPVEQAFNRQMQSRDQLQIDMKPDLIGYEKKLGTKILQLSDNTGMVSDGQKMAILQAMGTQKPKPSALDKANKDFRAASSDLINVYIYFNADADMSVINPYVKTVNNVDFDNHLATAWVSLENIKLLALLDEVKYIQIVEAPIVNAGSFQSEGDGLLDTDKFRSLNGVTGAGIKVGIISNGVDNIARAVSTGDLPEGVHILSNEVGGDEGTAMLEIVYDLAPGCELYFHDQGNDIIGFNAVIDELVNAGCNIICDDVSWPEEPYFEDGIVASHVNEIVALKNIVYISSAGNASKNHYQAQYNGITLGTKNYHDFGPESGQQVLRMEIPSKGFVRSNLQWDDRFGYSNNDYNAFLWVYNANKDIFELKDYSTQVQDGNDNPIESLFYYNSSKETQYAYIEIQKYSGVAKTLELFDFGTAKYLNYTSPADSIYGHAAASGVIAVGAINATNSSKTIADYSSQGPSTISYPSTQVRNKPDICAIDKVSVTGTGGHRSLFYGTSAAAPHIAALTALTWAKYPTLTATQVRTLVIKSTKDLGNKGFDYVYGNGLANALLI